MIKFAVRRLYPKPEMKTELSPPTVAVHLHECVILSRNKGSIPFPEIAIHVIVCTLSKHMSETVRTTGANKSTATAHPLGHDTD